MLILKKQEQAVSPVIGTILLVAITVMLVAIIAAVVMPMVSGVGHTHSVGTEVTFMNTTSAHTLNVCFTGGDIDKLDDVHVYAYENDLTPVDTYSEYKIGYTYRFEVSQSGAPFNVVGTFSDGTSQVLYTGRIPL